MAATAFFDNFQRTELVALGLQLAGKVFCMSRERIPPAVSKVSKGVTNMVELHKQNDNTASNKFVEADSHSLLSKEDWADFNNKFAKNKPAASENGGVVEFSNPYKSDSKVAKPDAKSSNEDNTRFEKKQAELEKGGKNAEKKFVPKPYYDDCYKLVDPENNGIKKPSKGDGGIKGGIDKPGLPNDGGIKGGIDKPGMPNDGGIKGGVDKPSFPNDGGIKDIVKKPGVKGDGDIKDGIAKPKPWMDGGIKDKGEKSNHAADSGLQESAEKPSQPADGGLKDNFVKANPSLDGGLKENFKADGMNGGEKENFNPPADAQTDGSDDEHHSTIDLSSRITGVRENFGNVTLASAPPLQQPWTVNGDGTVTRGTTRSVPAKS